MRKIVDFMAGHCRIGMLFLAAGVFAAAAHGQTSPYGGPPGYPGQQDPYGDWGQPDDDYGNYDGYDDYDNYDSYDNYDGYHGYNLHQTPSVDVGFFYGELSPYGEWVRHPNYGWVWFPRHVRAGWRPYSLGRWVESDYGWTWVSDEPFGWATYHYGRWAFDRRVGWLWVPGTDWAPAWVAWQQGDGYVGWAPLPPAVGFDVGVGIRLGGFSLSFGISPRHYSFVDERRFLDRRIGNYILPAARNVTIIHQTTNITNYTVVNNRVINHGVPVERIERATGRRAQRLRVATAPNPRSVGVQRDVINVYRPPESKLQSVKVAQRNNAGLRQKANQTKRAEVQNQDQDQKQNQNQNPKPRTTPQTERGVSAPIPIPVAPRVQPAPQKVDEHKFAREQQELKANQEKERRALEQAQRQDRAQAQAKAKDTQEVEKQHAAELQAQQEQRERATKQLQTRQQIERQAAQASADNAQRPPKAQTEPQKAKKGKKTKQDQKEKGEDQKPPEEN